MALSVPKCMRTVLGPKYSEALAILSVPTCKAPSVAKLLPTHWSCWVNVNATVPFRPLIDFYAARSKVRLQSGATAFARTDSCSEER